MKSGDQHVMTRSLAVLLTSLVKRLKPTCTADSRPSAAMSGLAPSQLFQALFPGQHYSDERAPELAAKLRALADEIQQGGCATAQPMAGEAEEEDVQGVSGAAGHSTKRRKKGGQERGVS